MPVCLKIDLLETLRIDGAMIKVLKVLGQPQQVYRQNCRHCIHAAQFSEQERQSLLVLILIAATGKRCVHLTTRRFQRKIPRRSQCFYRLGHTSAALLKLLGPNETVKASCDVRSNEKRKMCKCDESSWM